MLFDVAVNKFETIVEVWDQIVGNDSWKLNIFRALNDWEVDLVVNLLNVLQKESVAIELDKVSWKGMTCARSFSVWDFESTESGNNFFVSS